MAFQQVRTVPQAPNRIQVIPEQAR